MFLYNKVLLKPIEEEDLFFLRKLHNDPSTWFFLTDISLLTSKDQYKWLEQVNSSSKFKYFLYCKENKERLGLIRLNPVDYINRNVCVGLDIASRFRGQGFGTLGYQLILKYCFNYLNMHRIWLLVTEYNQIGIHLYKKIGFKEEGIQREAIYRDGKYHNYIMMSILKKEYSL